METLGIHSSFPTKNQTDYQDAGPPTVEARKLEHHSPHALKVKYKGS